MLIPRLTRRRLAGCALLAFLALAGWAWWLASPGRITQANFDRIRINIRDKQTKEIVSFGMTVPEVDAILGPGSPDPIISRELPPGDRAFRWWGGLTLVRVRFKDGHASERLIDSVTLRQRIRGRWFEATGRRGPF
jgi:hypothetical protein